jgi:hypothetical protein
VDLPTPHTALKVANDNAIEAPVASTFARTLKFQQAEQVRRDAHPPADSDTWYQFIELAVVGLSVTVMVGHGVSSILRRYRTTFATRFGSRTNLSTMSFSSTSHALHIPR